MYDIIDIFIGHKRHCSYRYCECSMCNLTDAKSDAQSKGIALKRQQEDAKRRKYAPKAINVSWDAFEGINRDKFDQLLWRAISGTDNILCLC